LRWITRVDSHVSAQINKLYAFGIKPRR
jgi:hypothetical protein